MLNFVGDFAVILNYFSFITAFLSVLFYFKSISYKKFLNLARISFHITVSIIIIMSFILLILILNHQYQYIYIFNNSSNDLPLGLLISTFYAGQEGSFLFWLLCLAITGLFLLSTGKKNEIESTLMASYGIIIVFLLLLLINKSPFEKIWSLYPEAIRTGAIPLGASVINLSSTQWVLLPLDGNGLNPLLQNFWMQIHPPVLFIGFSFMAVPFAFAISALLLGDFKKWVKPSMPWLILACLFLGAGLILGAFWAYVTLGWGGYWGWDPVENSSLIPWIVGIALIHTSITQMKTGGLIKTNLFLAVMSFVLVVYSTFLTRSGVLKDSSVHSFTEPGSIVYLLLFVFVASLLFLGVGLIIFRLKDISYEKTEYKMLSKEAMLSLGSIVLSISALLVLAGTSYPIFFKSAVEVSFYNDWNLPLAVLINIFNGLSLITGWNSDELKVVLKKLILGVTGASILTILAIIIGVTNLDMIILVWSSVFAIFINLEKLVRNIRFGVLKLGGVISHVGVALFFIGIVGSAKYSQTQHVELTLGETKAIFGYQVKYLGEELFDEGKKSYFNISIKGSNSNETILKPVMFVNNMANGVMRIPDIKETILKDIYVSPVGINEKKPLIQEKTLELKKDEPEKILDYDIIFDSYKMDMEQMMKGGEFSMVATIKLIKNKNVEIINLSTVFSQSGPKFRTLTSADGKLEFSLERIMKGEKPILILKYKELNQQMNDNRKEALVAEISIKPAINLFWFGNILMLAGFLLSYYKRKKEIIK